MEYEELMAQFGLEPEGWPPPRSEIHCASCGGAPDEINVWEPVCCLNDLSPGKPIWRVDLEYGCGTLPRPRPAHFFVQADSAAAVWAALPEKVRRDHMWLVTVTGLD